MIDSLAPFLYFVRIAADIASFVALAERCGCKVILERSGREIVMLVQGDGYEPWNYDVAATCGH